MLTSFSAQQIGAFMVVADALASLTQVEPVSFGIVPDLTHTRLRATRIGNRPLHFPNWNQLQREMVNRFLQTKSEARLARLGIREICFGRKTDQGFIYNRARNVSVRQCGSNRAADNVARLAKAIGIPLTVAYIHPRDRSRIETLQLAG